MPRTRSPQPRPPEWLPDEDTPSTDHRLEGLEPDNLLAFMALLGLLRALETARPEWRPRAYWDEDSPWRPVLVLSDACTQKELAQAAKDGLGMYSPVLSAIGRENRRERAARLQAELEATRSKLASCTGASPMHLEKYRKQIASIEKQIDRIEKQRSKNKGEHNEDCHEDREVDIEISLYKRAFMNSRDRNELCIFSSFCVDLISDGEEGALKPTPLKFVSGKQAFLGTAIKLLRDADIAEIAASLWQPWRHRHRGDTFRFDGAEYRLYAYLASDPTEKPKKTAGEDRDSAGETTGEGLAPSEKGANTLAVLGLLSFPVFRQEDVLIPSYSSGRLSERRIALPIWYSAGKVGASLAAIEALLRLSPESSALTPHEVRCWSSFRIAPSGKNEEYKCAVWDRFLPGPPASV